MTETVAMLNLILGTGGVLLLIGAAALYADILFFQRRHFGARIERWGLTLAASFLIGSSVMALAYSEVFGFVPCGLCWAMRIFVISQAFIITAAALMQDRGAALYGMILAVPGILIGLYQHYLQLGGPDVIGCPTTAEGADCAKRILFEYGFMTFPLLGVSMLLFVVAIYIYLYRRNVSQY